MAPHLKTPFLSIILGAPPRGLTSRGGGHEGGRAEQLGWSRARGWCPAWPLWSAGQHLCAGVTSASLAWNRLPSGQVAWVRGPEPRRPDRPHLVSLLPSSCGHSGQRCVSWDRVGRSAPVCPPACPAGTCPRCSPCWADLTQSPGSGQPLRLLLGGSFGGFPSLREPGTVGAEVGAPAQMPPAQARVGTVAFP